MPLIRDEGVTSHNWRPAGADEPLDTVSHVIAPGERLDEVLDGQAGRPVGLAVSNTIDVERLAPHFDAFALITIAFPSFADGRGFSLARRLRARGYDGELWASGHLIPDQYAFARACGFDAVDVDEAVFQRQREGDWLEAATSLSLSYQRSDAAWEAAPRSILELRRASRQSVAAE